MASYVQGATPTKEQIVKMREQAAACRFAIKLDDYREFDSSRVFIVWDDTLDLLHIVDINTIGESNFSNMLESPFKITSIDYAQIRNIVKLYER